MSNSRLKKRSLSQEDLFNFSELLKLMKPRVMSLVIFTCAVGLLTSPNLVSTKDAIIGILLVSLGAGAAGALNMWYESDLDALMSRTCLRPIPSGKINRNQALIFGITLSIISVIALIIILFLARSMYSEHNTKKIIGACILAQTQTSSIEEAKQICVNKFKK